MICPHCGLVFHPYFAWQILGLRNTDDERGCKIYYGICPKVKNGLYYGNSLMVRSDLPNGGISYDPFDDGAKLVYPKRKSHKPLSNDIPEGYRTEYEEAFVVIDDSSKASAALSRRLLQKVTGGKRKRAL